MLITLFILAVIVLPFAIPLIIISLSNSKEEQPTPYRTAYPVNNYYNRNMPQYLNQPYSNAITQPQFPVMPQGSTGANITPPPVPVRPVPPKKNKPDMTVSNILFLMGTAFIVLSGLAFGVAGWVHTTHIGRVAIIAAASAVFLILSVVINKALRLSGTSVSFYILSTGLAATSFLTAGYYKLMGEWFSFSGDGVFALIATSCLIASIMLYAGNAVFQKLPLICTALSTTALTVLFGIVQVCDDIEIAAPVFIAAQALIIAALYVFKAAEGKKYELPIKIVGICAAALYGGIALIYVLASFFDPTISSITIITVIIAQLMYYGISKKINGLIYAESIVFSFLALIIGIYTANTASDKTATLTFSGIMIASYLIHRFVPALRSTFTESSTLSVSAFGALMCLTSMTRDSFMPEIIMVMINSALIGTYVFDKSKAKQIAAGVTAPFIPFLASIRLGDMISGNFSTGSNAYTICMSVFSMILIISAAIMNFMPRIAPVFNAKYPRKTNAALYTDLSFAGFILMFLSCAKELTYIPAAICLIHFAMSNKLRNNITAVFSSISFVIAIRTILRNSNIQSSTVNLIVMMCILILYMGISRFVYHNATICCTHEKLVIDPMLAAGWLPIALMLGTTRTACFFTLLGSAIYCGCFIKKNTSQTTASILLSTSTLLTAAALIARPFFLPESREVSSKITIAIIALTGLACRYIWREFKEASKYSSNTIFIMSFIALLFDAMIFDTALNTIFVMGIMILVLIISIAVRSKTWFIASAASLFTITVYATREYLMALHWWIYLFIAGIILIGIASINEYCKKNNETLKTSVAKKFSGWSW